MISMTASERQSWKGVLGTLGAAMAGGATKSPATAVMRAVDVKCMMRPFRESERDTKHRGRVLRLFSTSIPTLYTSHDHSTLELENEAYA